jgi:hypothetical protein
MRRWSWGWTVAIGLWACAPKVELRAASAPPPACPEPTPTACPPVPAPEFDPARYGAIEPALDDVLLEPLPMWADRYAASPDDMGLRVDVPAAMQRWGLSRLDTVEVQNRLRDELRDHPDTSPVTALDAALAEVRAGQRESGLDPARLAAAPLIVVFDLDETLLDQSYPADLAASCKTFTYDDAGKTRSVQLAPGWESAFETVRRLGGEIVLFSANLDRRTEAILQTWTWRGQPLLGHPEIAGWMSNAYLVWVGKGTDERPVAEASKDLRPFDETLERVVLVDDNPLRVFQHRNLRVTQKFEANAWCQPNVDAVARGTLGAELPAAMKEIEESMAYAKAQGVSFAAAFLPYSALGRVSVAAVAAAQGWPTARAVAWVRAHPEIVAKDL